MRASEILWHYTDADGFYGIVSSHKLYLSDARFLNDRTERTFGTQVVLAALERLKLSAPYVGMTRLQNELRRPPTTNLFICSFSERNNSMAQWERYANRGLGYCLGFDKAQIARAVIGKPITLKRMVYSVRQQRTTIKAAIKQLLQQYEMDGTSRTHRDKGLMYSIVVAVALEELALQLKNPDFKDEREWRLIWEVRQRPSGISSSGPIIRFTKRGDVIKPYIEVMLPSRDTTAHSRLPLVSVVCGPRLEREVAVASAEYFLAQNGYHLPVQHSSLSAIWR